MGNQQFLILLPERLYSFASLGRKMAWWKRWDVSWKTRLDSQPCCSLSELLDSRLCEPTFPFTGDNGTSFTVWSWQWKGTFCIKWCLQLNKTVLNKCLIFPLSKNIIYYHYIPLFYEENFMSQRIMDCTVACIPCSLSLRMETRFPPNSLQPFRASCHVFLSSWANPKILTHLDERKKTHSEKTTERHQNYLWRL